MVPRQWRSGSSHHGSEQPRSPPAPQENKGDISTLPKTIGAVGSQGLATSGLFRARGTHPRSSPRPCGIWGTGPSWLIQDCWDAGTFPTPPFYCPLGHLLVPAVSGTFCLCHLGWSIFSGTPEWRDRPQKAAPAHPAASTCAFPLRNAFPLCLSVCLHPGGNPADTRRGKVSPPGTADLCVLPKGTVWDGAMTKTHTPAPSWCRAMTWSRTVATPTPSPGAA